MTTDLQARLRGFGYRPCPFDDPEHFQEVDDPCLVCGGLGTGGEPDKCVGNIDLLHNEAADEIARLTEEVERLEKYKNIIIEEHFEMAAYLSDEVQPNEFAGVRRFEGRAQAVDELVDVLGAAIRGEALTDYQGDGK